MIARQLMIMALIAAWSHVASAHRGWLHALPDPVETAADTSPDLVTIAISDLTISGLQGGVLRVSGVLENASNQALSECSLSTAAAPAQEGMNRYSNLSDHRHLEQFSLPAGSRGREFAQEIYLSNLYDAVSLKDLKLVVRCAGQWVGSRPVRAEPQDYLRKPKKSGPIHLPH